MRNNPTKYVVLGFLLCAIFLAVGGCSLLLPKKVELGQDKVEKFPVATFAQKEVVKQAVARATVEAREAEKIAIMDSSLASIPAGNAASLTEAVGRSLGPPAEPWKAEVSLLAEKVDRLTSKFDKTVEKFAVENDKNQGKKIEGTGWFQMNYFGFIGIGLVVLWLLFIVAKVALGMVSAANPAVGLGLNVVGRVGSAAVSKGFSEIIRGGENFKNAVKTKLEPAVAEKVLELFQNHHRMEQSPDTQKIVETLTR
jgi:hypothetical protein